MPDQGLQPVSFTKRSAKRIADVVRHVENSSYPPRNWYRRSHRYSPEEDGKPFHFQVLLGDAVSEYYPAVKVRCGFWRRRGHKVDLPKDGGGTSEDLNDTLTYDFTGKPAALYLLYVVLQEASPFEYIPELYPDSLALLTTTSLADDEWDRVRVIATVNWDGTSISFADDVQQKWFGGNIDDTVAMTDSYAATCYGSYCCSVRCTIEDNPQDSSMQGARQLYDVHTVQTNSKWAPYFCSCQQLSPECTIAGRLAWAVYDSESCLSDHSCQCTIEIAPYGEGLGMIQMYEADTACLNSVPFMCVAGACRWLYWQYPVTTLPSGPHNGTPWEFPVCGATGGFVGVDLCSSGSGGGDGTVGVCLAGHRAQIVDGRLEVGECIYCTSATFAISVCWQCLPQCTIYHSCLNFCSLYPPGMAGQNNDHDYRYFIRGCTYTQNHAQSIGYGCDPGCEAGVTMEIDLANELICTRCSCCGGTGASVNWKGKTLEVAGVSTLDWYDQCLVGLCFGSWDVCSACFIIHSTDKGCIDGGTLCGALQVRGGILVQETSCFACGDMNLHILDTKTPTCGSGTCNWILLAEGCCAAFGVYHHCTITCNLYTNGIYWQDCFNNNSAFCMKYDPSCQWVVMTDCSGCFKMYFFPNYLCVDVSGCGTMCFSKDFCASNCIIAGCSFFQGCHAGVDCGDTAFRIGKVSGGYMTVYIRGGILAVD